MSYCQHLPNLKEIGASVWVVGSGIEGDSQKYFSAILVEHVWTSPLDHATDLFVFVDLG